MEYPVAPNLRSHLYPLWQACYPNATIYEKVAAQASTLKRQEERAKRDNHVDQVKLLQRYQRELLVSVQAQAQAPAHENVAQNKIEEDVAAAADALLMLYERAPEDAINLALDYVADLDVDALIEYDNVTMQIWNECGIHVPVQQLPLPDLDLEPAFELYDAVCDMLAF